MKKLLPILSVFNVIISTSTFADEGITERYLLTESQSINKSEASSNNNSCQSHVNWTDRATIPSGRFPHNDKNWNLSLTGEALLWKATESGLEFALVTNTQATTSSEGGTTTHVTNNPAAFANLGFHSDWGFRINAGYSMRHDQWDFYASWIRFYTHANVSVAINDPSTQKITSYWADPDFTNVFESGDIPIVNIDSGTGNWHLHLNLVDAEIGKKFFAGKWLAIRPFVGLRGGWILQNYNQFFVESGKELIPGNILQADDTLKMQNNFRGVGILTGLDTQWGLFKELSLYADADVSLLYGDMKIARYGNIKGKRFDSSGETLLDIYDLNPSYQDRFLCCRAIIDLALGLRWDHMFANDRLHLGINIGWEEHYFLGQNQFLRTQGAIVTARNDLTVTGWTFGARMDF
jgi:hypothetical protein